MTTADTTEISSTYEYEIIGTDEATEATMTSSYDASASTYDASSAEISSTISNH